MRLVLDLDGVVWLGDTPIPGSAGAVARARASGARVVFLTNNSSATVATYVAKLGAHGIDASADDVVTSAQAAGELLAAEDVVLVYGGPGVAEAVANRGATTTTDPDSATAVVVGWHREFDFDRLARAARAVRSGARLIATNTDATYPTADGLLPGAGALVAAVEVASGATARVAGKPHQPIVDLLHARLGGQADLVVGDRVDTDGALAARLGAPFALVLTGVVRAGEVAGSDVAAVAPDLASLADQYGW